MQRNNAFLLFDLDIMKMFICFELIVVINQTYSLRNLCCYYNFFRIFQAQILNCMKGVCLSLTFLTSYRSGSVFPNVAISEIIFTCSGVTEGVRWVRCHRPRETNFFVLPYFQQSALYVAKQHNNLDSIVQNFIVNYPLVVSYSQ